MAKYLNIACGRIFSDHLDWLNLDYSPAAHVRGMNILEGIHTISDRFEVVYSSHFLEHVPPDLVPDFLSQCRRLTAAKGVFRVVVPDAEMLMREYLKHRESGDVARADYAFLLFLDQCTRRGSGGQLAPIHRQFQQGELPELKAYAAYLEGNHYLNPAPQRERRGLADKASAAIKSPGKLLKKLEPAYTRFVCSLLPKAFVAQNVSLTTVGERHAWMYDFESLRAKLMHAGYSTVTRQSFNTTCMPKGFFAPLDEAMGEPRKGHHQMFVEAHP